MGVKFRAEMARPAGPAPTRFPVNQSFILAATHNFFTLPEAVRRILPHTTPEEIARSGKQLGTAVSPLTIWMLGYHFLVGREVLLDLDEVSAKARADNISSVLDFWRRLAFTHRGDGHLDNSEAGATKSVFPPAAVPQRFPAVIPMGTRVSTLGSRPFSSFGEDS